MENTKMLNAVSQGNGACVFWSLMHLKHPEDGLAQSWNSTNVWMVQMNNFVHIFSYTNINSAVILLVGLW